MDLESAIESTEKLLQAATKEVLIYDGPFDPKLYGNEMVVRQIKDAIDRDVNVEVICDESAQVPSPVIAGLVNQGKILLYRRKFEKEPLKGLRRLIVLYPQMHMDAGHYIVVDGWHVRKETPHAVNSDIRRALISYVDEHAPKYVRHFRHISQT